MILIALLLGTCFACGDHEFRHEGSLHYYIDFLVSTEKCKIPEKRLVALKKVFPPLLFGTKNYLLHLDPLLTVSEDARSFLELRVLEFNQNDPKWSAMLKSNFDYFKVSEIGNWSDVEIIFENFECAGVLGDLSLKGDEALQQSKEFIKLNNCSQEKDNITAILNHVFEKFTPQNVHNSIGWRRKILRHSMKAREFLIHLIAEFNLQNPTLLASIMQGDLSPFKNDWSTYELELLYIISDDAGIEKESVFFKKFIHLDPNATVKSTAKDLAKLLFGPIFMKNASHYLSLQKKLFLSASHYAVQKLNMVIQDFDKDNSLKSLVILKRGHDYFESADLVENWDDVTLVINSDYDTFEQKLRPIHHLFSDKEVHVSATDALKLQSPLVCRWVDRFIADSKTPFVEITHEDGTVSATTCGSKVAKLKKVNLSSDVEKLNRQIGMFQFALGRNTVARSMLSSILKTHQKQDTESFISLSICNGDPSNLESIKCDWTRKPVIDVLPFGWWFLNCAEIFSLETTRAVLKKFTAAKHSLSFYCSTTILPNWKTNLQSFIKRITADLGIKPKKIGDEFVGYNVEVQKIKELITYLQKDTLAFFNEFHAFSCFFVDILGNVECKYEMLPLEEIANQSK